MNLFNLKNHVIVLEFVGEFNYRKANEAYFFTLIPQTYSTTEQMERAINGGHWKETGETEQIFHENEIVGFKRIIVFYEGQAPTAKESSSVIHEFSISPSLVMDDEPNIRTKVASSLLHILLWPYIVISCVKNVLHSDFPDFAF